MQTLELVEDRWDALMSGEKLDTIRWNEGTVEPGFLIYVSCPSPTRRTVVYVTDVRTLPLREVMLHTKDTTTRRPNEQILLESMRRHYPDITLDTEILFVQHLSPELTASQYPQEVADITASFT